LKDVVIKTTIMLSVNVYVCKTFGAATAFVNINERVAKSSTVGAPAGVVTAKVVVLIA
jgi:hypothetical protein